MKTILIIYIFMISYNSELTNHEHEEIKLESDLQDEMGD